MNNYFKYFQLVLFLLASLSIASCGEKDDGDGGGTPICEGSLSFDLDGVDWVATSFNNTLLKANDPATGLDVKRFDLRATNADGFQLIISFTNPGGLTGDCMKTGDYVSIDNVTSSLDDVALFTYLDSNNATVFTSIINTFTVTECNETEKTISGTFTFEDFFEEKFGSAGVFTDVCYSN